MIVSGVVALMWSAAPTLVGDLAATRALLDQTAIDTADLSCGGTAENNNVFGEGRREHTTVILEEMLRQGFLFMPSGKVFISTAHTTADIEATAEALDRLLRKS